MKKILLIVSLCFLSLTNSVTAQDFNFTYSEGFPEQKEWSKLKLLSNGTTFLINVAEQKEIYLNLYNGEGKSIAKNTIQPKDITRRLKYIEVSAVYEINKEIVVFLANFIEADILIRLIIDPVTLQLKSEEVIHKIKYFSDGIGYSGRYMDEKPVGFFVKKDPQSDYYAVLILHSVSANNKSLEIVHYAPDHKEINRAFLSIPVSNFKYLNYSGMYVKRDEYIIVGTYFENYDKKSQSTEIPKIFISKLNKGSSEFQHKEIPTSNTFLTLKCKLDYDKKNNLLNLIYETRNDIKKESLYFFFTQPVNPDNLELSKSFPLPYTKANDYYLSKVDPGSKKGYEGMVHNYIIDQTGNHLALLQNTKIIYDYDKNSAQTLLQEIAISSFDKQGQEKFGFIIPCNYYIDGEHKEFMYYDPKKGYKEPLAYTGYGFPRYWLMQIDLVAGKKNDYVFMNNLADNFDNPDNQKAKKMVTVSSLNATYYKLDANGEMTRGYLFGKPSKANQNQFCNFNSSDYSEETGVYATVVTQEIKGDKISKVVWFNLDK